MIYLRELSREDLENTWRWRQDPTLIEWLGEPFRFINRESEQAWFDAYLQQRERQVRLAICLQTDHRHIGNLNLTQIHPVHRTAEFSLMIGEADCRGRGLGRAATALGLAHAFNDLNLHRLELRVRLDNLPALKVYQALGFQQEGRLRGTLYKGGRWHDQVIMGLLAEDYFASQAEPEV